MFDDYRTHDSFGRPLSIQEQFNEGLSDLADEYKVPLTNGGYNRDENGHLYREAGDFIDDVENLVKRTLLADALARIAELERQLGNRKWTYTVPTGLGTSTGTRE